MIAAVAIDVHPEALHRLSIDEYHELIRAGGFDEDARIELLDGLLVDMRPKTPRHEHVVAWLADWLRDHVGRSAHQVRVGAPLTIGGSEPEPDLVVIALPHPPDAHPSTALLVIEVSHSSLRRDLHEKPALYAQAGVDEYWVLDLDASRAVRHRDPLDGAYRDIAEYLSGGSWPGDALGLPALTVDGLFEAARL
jgi:Uma2 family endonuclease